MPSGSPSIEAGEAARGATLYVTLEPCSHFGVSPPCVDAIISSGVARVVSAMEDPNPLVGGEGHARLRAAGIAVSVGVGADPGATRPSRPYPARDSGAAVRDAQARRDGGRVRFRRLERRAPAHHRADRRPSRPDHALDPRGDHGRDRDGARRRSGLDRAAARPRSQAVARRPRHPSAAARTLAPRGDGGRDSDPGHRGRRGARRSGTAA